ncbi:FtsZ/tubulin family protein [Mycoplasmopsis opalescens]|uniref:hypothetical protein n=1 Tax=Mycoplasmopsis opalescens TaxID=114886 RepID=UPI0004A716F1|nr:hypothetical protein [Mycoplasmopsis opalescens]
MENNDFESFLNYKIKVFGLGGAGSNAVNYLVENLQEDNIDYFVINTDAQDLNKSNCINKIFIGQKVKGKGTGGNIELGKQATLDNIDEITKNFDNTDILILVAGLGGGTGTGAIAEIAQKAYSTGIFTLAFVTTPLTMFNSNSFDLNAFCNSLAKVTNSYMVIDSDKLTKTYQEFPIKEVFNAGNIYIQNAIATIKNLLYKTGHINLDFNDLKRVLSDGRQMLILSSESHADNPVNDVKDSLCAENALIYDAKMLNEFLLMFEYDDKVSYQTISILKDELVKHYGSDQSQNVYKIGLFNANVDHKSKYFAASVIATYGESDALKSDIEITADKKKNLYESKDKKDFANDFEFENTDEDEDNKLGYPGFSYN